MSDTKPVEIKPVKMVMRPWITAKEGRDHLRCCATGDHLTISMGCREVRDLCCDVDSLVFWYKEHMLVLEAMRQFVKDAFEQKREVPPQLINSVLERVGMYVQPPETT